MAQRLPFRQAENVPEQTSELAESWVAQLIMPCPSALDLSQRYSQHGKPSELPTAQHAQSSRDWATHRTLSSSTQQAPCACLLAFWAWHPAWLLSVWHSDAWLRFRSTTLALWPHSPELWLTFRNTRQAATSNEHFAASKAPSLSTGRRQTTGKGRKTPMWCSSWPFSKMGFPRQLASLLRCYPRRSCSPWSQIASQCSDCFPNTRVVALFRM